jgi:hypothetical protein
MTSDRFTSPTYASDGVLYVRGDVRAGDDAVYVLPEAGRAARLFGLRGSRPAPDEGQTEGGPSPPTAVKLEADGAVLCAVFDREDSVAVRARRDGHVISRRHDGGCEASE